MSAGGYPTAPVALTFDDGPDPQWTPLVLDALAGATASATFFVLHRCRFDRGPGLELRPTPRGLGGFTCDRGRIELADDGSLPDGVVAEHAEQGRLRHEWLLAEPGRVGNPEHWQFLGASLALTASVYADVGGLEPLADLEDEHLEGVLRRHGIPIDRLLSVRVTTSPRLKGRANRGLAHDLAARSASLDQAGRQAV